MFYSLPAETVFEAKQRTRRATFYFFILLVLLYVFFVDLMAVAAYIFVALWTQAQFHSLVSGARPSVFPAVLYGTPLAVFLATFHFLTARAKTLDDLLVPLGAKPADPRDAYHQQFIHLVGEAEAATGIHGIRPVVLSTPGCNAFSLQDGRGQSAIGVTDGILSKLTRQELSAVVAHEAAHLVHEDSKLVTTACFLFGFFGTVNEALGKTMSHDTDTFYERRSGSRSGGGSFWGAVLVLWIISGAGYLITKLVFMAISREREFLADADGVAMCKDPLALAEGLYKISRRFRGGAPDSYSSLFIMNPGESEWDEEEGFFANLFSNHPPVSQRLSKLLTWAKADMKILQEGDSPDEKSKDSVVEKRAAPPAPEEPQYMAHHEGKWVGPYSPDQLLSMGLMSPASWVCPAGSQKVTHASEVQELRPLFLSQVKGTVTVDACPRCKVPLLAARYEGTEVEQCSFCKGYLLGAGVLERLISRGEKTFAPEDIQKARVWRDSQRGSLKDRDSFPAILCPRCTKTMGKGVHTMLTQVIIDRCPDEPCGSIWCDGGELETIQMIIEDAHRKH